MISDAFLFLYDAFLFIVAIAISIFLLWIIVMFPFVIGAFLWQACTMTCRAKSWCKRKIFGDKNALDRARHGKNKANKQAQE
jgi:predicted membrane protein